MTLSKKESSLEQLVDGRRVRCLPPIRRSTGIALAVDCVLFGFDDADLKLLLVQRQKSPFNGDWALPEGFVRAAESLDEAALRELNECAGLADVYLEQLFSFGEVDRDPRGRVVTIAYYALVELDAHPTQPGAQRTAWFSVNQLPPLAFDHAGIIRTALNRLKSKVRYEPIGFELLPPKFTLSQIQHLYEAVLETRFDKRNFRKKLLGMKLLRALDEFETAVSHRAARLYAFDPEKYRVLKVRGFHFEL